MNEKKSIEYSLTKRIEDVFVDVVTSVLYYPPTTLIVSCSEDKDIYVLDSSNEQVKTIANDSEVKSMMVWDSQTFLCCLCGSKVVSYDLQLNFKKGKVFDYGRSKPYRMLKLGDDRFVSAISKGDVLLTSYTTKNWNKVNDRQYYDVSSIRNSKLYENSIFLTTGFRNKNRIVLLDCTISKTVKSFQQHSLKVHSIETFLTPTEEEILACSIYEKIVLYNTNSENIIFEITTPRSSSYSMLMLENRFLVCGEHMKKSNEIGIFDLGLNRPEITCAKISKIVISSERNWKVTSILSFATPHSNESSNTVNLCCSVGKVVQTLQIENLKSLVMEEEEDDDLIIEQLMMRKMLESRDRLRELDKKNFLDIRLRNKVLDNICKIFFV